MMLTATLIACGTAEDSDGGTYRLDEPQMHLPAEVVFDVSTSTSTVEVINYGGAPLAIEDASIAFSNAFVVDFAGPVQLAPGESIDIQVELLSLEDEFGYLRLVTNDALRPIQLVELVVE